MQMNRIIICSVLFLLLSVSAISALDYGDRESLTLLVQSQGSFDLTATSTNAKITMVNATLLEYARTTGEQYVYWTRTIPDVNLNEDPLSFLFANPRLGTTHFSLETKLDTSAIHPAITTKVLFPLRTLDSTFYQYLEPQDIIDITPEIQRTASELAAGKTDLLEVEFALADYVHSTIHYDLNTLTTDVSQKSSWVLANREGVCDEITSLFISMNRALGIPARYVSGYAYTNLDIFGTDWVPHAWAEVYIPKYGWVPYDVTYGEFGFIDAGHIQFGVSLDARSSSITYTSTGRDVTLRANQLNTTISVLETGLVVSAPYTIAVNLFKEETGLDSYNIVEGIVKNPTAQYMIADISLAETENIAITDQQIILQNGRAIHQLHVLLHPFEEKKVYWLVHIDGALNSNYQYTFPITVYNSYNQTATARWLATSDGLSVRKNDAVRIISTEELTQASPYSKQVTVECTSDRSKVYLNESIAITCVIDNKGDTTFPRMQICIDGNCSLHALGIEKYQFTVKQLCDKTGTKIIEVRAEDSAFSKSAYISIAVEEYPQLVIDSIQAPTLANYHDPLQLSFRLHEKSSADPSPVTLRLSSPTMHKEWLMTEFSQDQEFIINMNGNNLKPGLNIFTVTAMYHDHNGKNYETTESFTIESQANFFQNILLYVNYWFFKMTG